jgi:Flp pilus assembly pilin Flp
MNGGRACHPQVTRRRQHGGAAIEYVVVVGALLAVLAFGGPTVSELLKALRDAWTSFLHALSISWI